MHDDLLSTPSTRSWRTALGIGALYAVTGMAWVLWSDAALQTLSADPAWLATAQNVKGALYVAVTAACLVGLVHWANERVLKAASLTRQALRRQESRFAQLHETLGDVVWLAEATTYRILYVSPSFEDVYGRSVADFVRDPTLWLQAVLEEDRERAAASVDELLRLGGSSREYRIQRPDGTIRWISDRKRVIRDEDGEVRMIGGVGEDITDSKQLDEMQASTRPALAALLDERTAEARRQLRRP